MNSSRVFVPAHITGFFVIRDASADPLKKGSLGAGINLRLGITTEINLQEGNGKIIFDTPYDVFPQVSFDTAQMIMQEIPLEGIDIHISQYSDIPNEAGLGASGAGALGVAMGIFSAADIPITINEAAQYAHRAEVQNRTGLGDVIAQVTGSLEVRIKHGAPGIGHVNKYLISPNKRVVFISKSGMKTSSVLSDPVFRNEINKAGLKKIDEILKNPSIDNFMELSYEFARESGLMPDEIVEILDLLKKEGFKNSSMIMLGHSIFSVLPKSEALRELEFLKNNFPDFTHGISEIDVCGAHLI